MNELAEQISASLDIFELISTSVNLRKSSRGYVGLCPFHQEDTPSFHVYTDTQSYYCFGCHRGGNIFSYVMEKEHVSFPEALQILADRAHITLPDKRGRKDNRTQDILKAAEEFFMMNLKSPSANAPRKYIMKRKLSEGDIETFRLGYAPDAWDALTVYLRKQGITDRAIVNSGLALQSDRGRIYDRFRGRIIFPIHDITGRTIGFGGRDITGEGAKYINSPESEIYHKRRNLYLLDRARNAISEKKRSILCEGYMDAIRLHKSGFHESVASLGTSLTAEQAGLLSRYADRCYICYDSDTAGQNASIRGMYILQSHGLDVRVISLPEGKDPDEYLLSHSPDEFEELITKADPLIITHIKALSSRLNDSSTRKSAIRELLSSLEALSASEVLEYKAQLCDATHIIPSELERMIISKSKIIAPEPEHQHQSEELVNEYYTLECALCAVLMHEASMRLKINPDDLTKMLSNSDVRELALSILNEDVNGLAELWLQTGDKEKLSIIERGDILCHQMPGKTNEEIFMIISNGLKRKYIDRRIAEINALPSNERNYEELFRLYKEREKYQK